MLTCKITYAIIEIQNDLQKLVFYKQETANGLTAVISYLYDSNDEVYGFTYNNKTYIYVKTIQGDVGGIINATDNIACIGMIYDAWGNVTYDYNEELDSLGNLEAMIVASMNSIMYRGYFYDVETGLYYLQSRYYDPETGRFINADDTAYIGYDSSPLSTNIFAYCANNPIKYSDYNGFVAPAVVVAGIALPVGIAGIVAYKTSLAVKLYMLSIANVKRNQVVYEFTKNNEFRDIYKIMVKRFKESTVVKNRIKEYIRRGWDYENEPISFYAHSIANLYSDYDLHYAVGELEKFHLYVIKKANRKYKIEISTYEWYNFEHWDKSKAEGFTKWVNNYFGYWLQQHKKLRPYVWTVVLSYEIRI